MKRGLGTVYGGVVRWRGRGRGCTARRCGLVCRGGIGRLVLCGRYCHRDLSSLLFARRRQRQFGRPFVLQHAVQRRSRDGRRVLGARAVCRDVGLDLKTARGGERGVSLLARRGLSKGSGCVGRPLYGGRSVLFVC